MASFSTGKKSGGSPTDTHKSLFYTVLTVLARSFQGFLLTKKTAKAVNLLIHAPHYYGNVFLNSGDTARFSLIRLIASPISPAVLT